MSDNMRAQVGQDSHVVVELIDDQENCERMEFDLVAESAADFASGRVGVNTPLGKAIRGKFVGNVVEYARGDIRKVRILQVTPLPAKVTEDANARRQAILDAAVRKAERTNTEMFAASYDGKWGDYNTEGMREVTETTDDASSDE